MVQNIAAGAIGTPEFTLSPSVVETVNITENLSFVDIISDGAAAIWYTTTGVNPTVGGANCWYIPAVAAVDTVTVSGDVDSIRLISAGSPKVRVQKR